MTQFRKNTVAGEEQQLLDANGKVVGVQFVDVKNMTDVDSWVAVDTVVREYAQVNPNEVREFIEANAVLRVNNQYRTGANSSNTSRHALSIPVGLMHKLEFVMPDIFTNKRKLRHFMKCYKGFTACETI
jgi:hypothetical protein